MLSLDRHHADIGNLNLRVQRAGPERVGAGDLKLTPPSKAETAGDDEGEG